MPLNSTDELGLWDKKECYHTGRGVVTWGTKTKAVGAGKTKTLGKDHPKTIDITFRIYKCECELSCSLFMESPYQCRVYFEVEKSQEWKEIDSWDVEANYEEFVKAEENRASVAAAYINEGLKATRVTDRKDKKENESPAEKVAQAPFDKAVQETIKGNLLEDITGKDAWEKKRDVDAAKFKAKCKDECAARKFKKTK